MRVSDHWFASAAILVALTYGEGQSMVQQKANLICPRQPEYHVRGELVRDKVGFRDHILVRDEDAIKGSGSGDSSSLLTGLPHSFTTCSRLSKFLIMTSTTSKKKARSTSRGWWWTEFTEHPGYENYESESMVQ